MFKGITNFIKYNNATVLILAIIFLIGTGAWAQTPAGQVIIGQKQVTTEGVDNALLLEADLGNFSAEYKIEKILADEENYYITFTYLDLMEKNNAWQYQVMEKVRKVSKKLREDLGEYLAEELAEEAEARLKYLRAEQARAQERGEAVREEVTEYSGLIGQTLTLAGRVFPEYEPVKKRALPSPTLPPTVLFAREGVATVGQSDSITDVYTRYMEENDPDKDDVFGILDNCPNNFNPEQIDSDNDGLGDVCDPYFTLAPEEESTTTPGEATTTPGEVIPDESGTSTEETIAPPTPEEAAAEEEPEVEVIELPVVQ